MAGPASSRLRWGVLNLSVAYGFGAIASFSLSALAGRFLGASALGTYAIASTIARVFYTGTDLGTSPHLVREIARDRSSAGRLASLFVSCRVLLVPVGVVFSVVVASVLGHGDWIPFALFAVASGAVSVQVVFEVLAQAHERTSAAALLNACASLATLLAAGVWLVTERSLGVLLGLYAAGACLANVVALVWTHRSLALRLHWRPSLGEFRSEVARSWRTGVSFLLSNVAQRTPVLVLGAFSSTVEVGTFAAVDLFVTAAAIVQAALSNAYMPRLAHSFGRDPARFRAAFWSGNAALAAVGLACALGLVLVGEPVIGYVFSSKDFHQVGDVIPIVA